MTNIDYSLPKRREAKYNEGLPDFITTATFSSAANISVSGSIEFLVAETRWWVKLWYIITFRKTPPRAVDINTFTAAPLSEE